MDVPHLVFHFPVEGHMCGSQFGAIMNKTAGFKDTRNALIPFKTFAKQLCTEFEVKLSELLTKMLCGRKGREGKKEKRGERDENLGLLKWSRQICHLVIDKMISLH